MLPMVRAGIDTRGDYERDLERAIEARRAAAREYLEACERANRAEGMQS